MSLVGPANQFVYRARDAALVMVGAAAILLGTARLVLSTSASTRDQARDLESALPVAITIAACGAIGLAAGLVRAMFQLPVVQLPPIALFGALAVAGVVALIFLPPEILGWIDRSYLPSDPRSQPSHVLGAVLCFGSFAVVVAVIGFVMFLSLLVRSRPSSGDIGAH